MICKECPNVTPKQAKDYILGFTLRNDLSCRIFQIKRNSGGQLFYAKAFDKFAAMGPTLISPELFSDNSSWTFITRVSGAVRQTADIRNDMMFSPEKILSHIIR